MLLPLVMMHKKDSNPAILALMHRAEENLALCLQLCQPCKTYGSKSLVEVDIQLKGTWGAQEDAILTQSLSDRPCTLINDRSFFVPGSLGGAWL